MTQPIPIEVAEWLVAIFKPDVSKLFSERTDLLEAERESMIDDTLAHLIHSIGPRILKSLEILDKNPEVDIEKYKELEDLIGKLWPLQLRGVYQTVADAYLKDKKMRSSLN